MKGNLKIDDLKPEDILLQVLDSPSETKYEYVVKELPSFVDEDFLIIRRDNEYNPDYAFRYGVRAMLNTFVLSPSTEEKLLKSFLPVIIPFSIFGNPEDFYNILAELEV